MGDGKYKGVIPKAIGEIFDYIEKVLYSVFNLPTIYWIFKKILWSNRFLSNVVSIHFLFKQLRESGAMCSSQDNSFSWSNYVLIISFLGDVLTERYKLSYFWSIKFQLQ